MSKSKPIIHPAALKLLKALSCCAPNVSNSDLEYLTSSSKSSVEYALRALVKAGCIVRTGRRDRTITLTARGNGCLGGHVSVRSHYQRPTKRMEYSGKAKPRSCRMCLETFDSEGPGNRVCDQCKSTVEWKSSSSTEYHVNRGRG